jgi:hypothetical protein
MMSTMTSRERSELAQLCRRREKLAKTAVIAHAAVMKADFQKQLASRYSFDDRTVWQQANALAEAATEKANAAIAQECGKLGIPTEFAPGLHTYWSDRGANAVASRRTELQKVAYTRIEALASGNVNSEWET